MKSENKKTLSPSAWLYVLFGTLVVGLLAWSSLRTLRESPSREVNLEVTGQGWVTLQLKTDPFPPLPGGTVLLTLASTNSGGALVNLGASIPFTFGMKNSSSPVGSGSASPDPQSGSYRANIQFPAPGDYWLSFTVGDSQPARFDLYVKPAQ